ncbi:MAG: glycosyltransferase, partial [Phycisphaerales bacterium]
AEHEAAMLRHLVVGLADESVGVVMVLPVGEQGDGEAMPGGAETVTYRASRWGVLRDWRVWGLRKKLAEMDADVIHAMDESLMGVALRLGGEMGLPVVCGCWSMGGAEVMAKVLGKGIEASGSAREGGTDDRGERMMHVTLMGVTGAISERLEREARGGHVRVELIRPGVMRVGEEAGEPLSSAEGALCLLVIGDGKVDAAMGAFFEGAAKARTKLTQMQLFLYSSQDAGHRWWKKAQEMGILGQVCLVGADAGSQRMLVRSDVVLMPQAGGVMRTLMLATMSAGRPVIAAADATMDDLIDGTTARLLHSPTAEQWAQTLIELPEQAEELRALGGRAREYVRKEHGIAAYVNRVIGVYRAATGEPIRFGDL